METEEHAGQSAHGAADKKSERDHPVHGMPMSDAVSGS